MSDHSETSSINGEWDNMSDLYKEMVDKMEQMEEEMKKMKTEMKEKDEEVERNKEEVKIIREENEAQAKELAFSLEEWMKAQMESMKLASVKLNEKTLEVFKKIWEKGAEKAQSKSSSDRRKLAEEIQKLEDLCEEISKDVQVNSEDCLKKMMSRLDRTCDRTSMEPATSDRHNENRPIDSFLGTYTLDESEPVPNVSFNNEIHAFKTLVIRKKQLEDNYEFCYITENGEQFIAWAPGNLARVNHRVWVEGKILRKVIESFTEQYELTEKGLKMNGKFAFVRV